MREVLYNFTDIIILVPQGELFISPLLFCWIEYNGLLAVVVISLQLVAQDTLHRIALKCTASLLDGFCHRHVLFRGGRIRGVELEMF